MSDRTNLQDTFLAQLLKEKTNVSIFLMNGIKLHGVIDAYDEHVIFLKNAITQMVYKHSVSTVVPAHKVNVS